MARNLSFPKVFGPLGPSLPERRGGRCGSLELVPELHRIGAAAMVAAALSRTEAVRGDIYDLDTLSACVGGARVNSIEIALLN